MKVRVCFRNDPICRVFKSGTAYEWEMGILFVYKDSDDKRFKRMPIATFPKKVVKWADMIDDE